MRAIALIAAALLAALTSAAVALARAGDLDTSFDGDGRKTIPELSSVKELAVQPDGKIVAVGSVVGDFGVVRLNPDGSLDTTFDGDGLFTLDVGDGEYAEGVALQPDGNIVVVGTTTVASRIAILRLTPSGGLDNSFDGDGRVAYDLGGTDEAYDVAIQPDGKIVLAGVGYPTEDVVVARLNPNGMPDGTFSMDGFDSANLGGTEYVSSMALQPDGKILVGSDGPDNTAALRFNPNGGLDSTFDGNGKAEIASGFFNQTEDLALQPDGKIILAGYGGPNDLATARLLPNGSPDPAWSGDGFAPADFGGNEQAHAVTLQSDGRIVVAGRRFFGPTGLRAFAVARFDSNGELDPTFGTDGKTSVEFTANSVSLEVAQAAIQQPDGQLVVAGDSNGDGVLARLDVADPPPPGDGADPGGDGGGGGTGTTELTRTLTLRYSGKSGKFKGAVDSNEAACEAGKVKVFEKRKGKDPEVGTDKTNDAGKWSFKEKGADGKFFATIAEKTVPAGICPAAKSKARKVG